MQIVAKLAVGLVPLALTIVGAILLQTP